MTDDEQGIVTDIRAYGLSRDVKQRIRDAEVIKIGLDKVLEVGITSTRQS